MKKLKTYILILSKTFPATHTRAGEETGFGPKMMAAIDGMPCFHKKLHTIRGNYELWQQRFNKIMAGEAVLSVREWVGKPYGKGSTVREIVRLTREDGIGLQQVYLDSISSIIGDRFSKVKLEEAEKLYRYVRTRKIAENDGLSYEDWEEWFRHTNRSKPYAIIHFTNFRY